MRNLMLAIAGLILAAPSVSAGDTTFHKPIAGQLPYFLKQDITPIWQIGALKKNQLMSLPKLSGLESQLQSPLLASTKQGKVAVVNFFYTTCQGICPKNTHNIKRAYRAWQQSDDVVFMSFSVTPNIDSLKVLANFAKSHDVGDGRWHFVRGPRKVIYNIAREHLQADMALDLGRDEDQFVHSESAYLIDQLGFVRGIYNSNVPRDMKRMATDMTMLGIEQPKIARKN